MPSSTRGLVLSAVMSCAVFATLSSAASAGGRPDGETQKWFGHFTGGYAFGQGDTTDNVDDTWTLGGGATYWPTDWPLGLSLDLTYMKFDLSGNSIDKINKAVAVDPNNSGKVDGGNITNWQATVNAIWGPGSHSNGIYLTGGIGAYYLKGVATQTGLVYYPPVCDPWYWWCYPGGVGQGSVVKGEQSEWDFGWNVGLGYSIAVSDGQLFVEAKYHSISTKNSDFTYLPLTIGYRW